jgi:hypothetical protein
MMSFTAALLGGLQGSVMRGMTISLGIDGFFAFPTIIYLLIGGCLAGFQLKSLNIVMENYDQVKATPIYESSLIIMNICCGLIISNE